MVEQKLAASPAAGDAIPLARAVEPPPRLWLGHSDAIAAVWLIGSLLCIGLAACMSVGDQRRVYFLNWSQPIPETCTAYSRFGVDCPGCGLTRTFIHLVHGQFAAAWRLSPVGALVFLFACVQIPPGIAQLVFRSRARWVEAWGLWNDWGTALLVIALLLQWLVRLSERMWT
ncbi:MAG: DUF2752 domain-containing protein [Aureliella sp.]